MSETKPKAPSKSEREAKLAQALRDNLKRRKAGGAAPAKAGKDDPAA